MLHDFLITDDFIIIPDLPLEADGESAFKNNHSLFKFRPDQPCRYGVLRKDATNDDDIKWFDAEPHYCFHFFNACQQAKDLKVPASS